MEFIYRGARLSLMELMVVCYQRWRVIDGGVRVILLGILAKMV